MVDLLALQCSSMLLVQASLLLFDLGFSYFLKHSVCQDVTESLGKEAGNRTIDEDATQVSPPKRGLFELILFRFCPITLPYLLKRWQLKFSLIIYRFICSTSCYVETAFWYKCMHTSYSLLAFLSSCCSVSSPCMASILTLKSVTAHKNCCGSH